MEVGEVDIEEEVDVVGSTVRSEDGEVPLRPCELAKGVDVVFDGCATLEEVG